MPFGDPENCFLTLRRVGMRKTARLQDRKVARPLGCKTARSCFYRFFVVYCNCMNTAGAENAPGGRGSFNFIYYNENKNRKNTFDSA